MAGITHWSCFCPKTEECGNKAKFGWHDSEHSARTKIMNHLMGSKHNLEEDEARHQAGKAVMETWGPSKRKRSDDGDDQRQGGNVSAPRDRHAALTDSPSQSSNSNQGGAIQRSSNQGGAIQSSRSSSSQDPLAAMRTRAETAEQQMEFLNNIILRMVESVTKSVAAMNTASLFARSAADAFTTEHHNLQRELDKIQALYAGTDTSL